MKTKKERETEVAKSKDKELKFVEGLRTEEALKRLAEISKELEASEEARGRAQSQCREFAGAIAALEREKNELSKQNSKLIADVSRLRRMFVDTAIKLLQVTL